MSDTEHSDPHADDASFSAEFNRAYHGHHVPVNRPVTMDGWSVGHSAIERRYPDPPRSRYVPKVDPWARAGFWVGMAAVWLLFLFVLCLVFGVITVR